MEVSRRIRNILVTASELRNQIYQEHADGMLFARMLTIPPADAPVVSEQHAGRALTKFNLCKLKT